VKVLKVLVLGCGQIGSVIGSDFARAVNEADVVFADKNPEKARTVASMMGGVNWMRVDSENRESLSNAFKGFDIVIVALPGDFGYKALKSGIEAGVDMVDISFSPENSLSLSAEASKKGITIIPDCGVAPGLSNILVGHAASKLDTLYNVHILVGGIPEQPVPPLGYTVTWSAEGLIDEYIRGAFIVENGLIVEVPALSGLEEIDVPGVGRLEAFYTDGLRTLLHTFPKVGSMYEKTLRYTGHIQKIKLLKELGFFEDEPLEVEGMSVHPRIVTARILERSLRKPDVGDILAMMVEVDGIRQREKAGFKYHLLDRFDKTGKVTAMARTTAYTASIVAQSLAKGHISEKGVVPPEKLGMKENLFNRVISGLNTRGVRVLTT
jgi:lysine 6-dehydrogenase